MNNNLLTIFTPTYNRAKRLSNLWESLCSQSNKDFIWLIIDDGSTDDTREVVEKWAIISPFKIIYIYQPNSGKHVAHNKAAELCCTPLFMCVDSDDILLPNTVGLIHSYWQEYLERKNEIIGWCTRKGNLEGKPVRDKNWPCDEPELSCVSLFENLGFRGETALIWKADWLKHYKLPVVPKERFVTEQVLYYQMSYTKKMKLKNDIFYLFEYYNDGYTKQGLRLQANNPIGAAIGYRVQYWAAHSLYCRIKKALKYKIWLRYFNISEYQVLEYFTGMKYEASRLYIGRGINWGLSCMITICFPIIKMVIRKRLKNGL